MSNSIPEQLVASIQNYIYNNPIIEPITKHNIENIERITSYYNRCVVVTERLVNKVTNLKNKGGHFAIDLLLGFYVPTTMKGRGANLRATLRLNTTNIDIQGPPGIFIPALTTPNGKTLPIPVLSVQYNDIELNNHTDEEIWVIYAVCSHNIRMFIACSHWHLVSKHGVFGIVSGMLGLIGRQRIGHKMPSMFTEVCQIMKQPHAVAMKNMLKYEKELIAKTWHPSRFVDWCLDHEEKSDIGVCCP